MKGKLIVLEGIDGSGKSTQAKLLKADFLLAFPRYNYFFGKIIKLILHHEWGKKLSPYLVAGFFALDRLMAKKTINGYLEAGKTVLLDRYTGSSQAHQGAKLTGAAQQKLIDWIDWLENKFFQLPQADKVIYLQVPPQISKKLMRSRQKDEAEKEIVVRDDFLASRVYLLIGVLPANLITKKVKNRERGDNNDDNNKRMFHTR